MLERLIRNLQAAAAVLMTDDARAARRLRRRGENKCSRSRSAGDAPFRAHPDQLV
jgi:hypothetical protein